MARDSRVRTKAVAYSFMFALLDAGAYGRLREVNLNVIAPEIGSSYDYLWQLLRLLSQEGYLEIGLRRQRNGTKRIMVRIVEPPEEGEAA